jgi:hypothetical protein
MAAVDAFDAVQRSGKLLPAQLRTLVDTVSSPRRPLYENACDFMRVLSLKWPEVTAAIRTMSRSTKAHVRFNAILCLGSKTDEGVIDVVLKSALGDKSARVRAKAADWIGRLRRKELVPELAGALAAERNVAARATMEFELRLLRDGYILDPAKSGGYNLTVHTQDGTSGRWVDEATLRSEGVEAIAAELRQQ